MSANVNQINKDEMNNKEANNKEINNKERNITEGTTPEADELYTKKEQENKKQNKKAGVTFAILMVIGVLVGVFSGMASNTISAFLEERNLTDAVGNAITKFIGEVSPFAIIIIFAVSVIYSVVVFRKAKAKWEANKDADDEVYEEAYDEVNKSLSGVLNLTSLGTIVVYGLFGAGFYYMIYGEMKVWFLISTGVFALYLAYTIVCQQKVIDLTKVMNPEKQGSVYDMKFQDKWHDSCDEMERAMIGKCAMKAFRVTQNLCVFLWVFFVLLAMVFEITLWPVFIVTLIWFVLTISYLLEAKKLEGYKKSEK